MFSILIPVKDPALPSSYRPISILDTTGKLFENILLCRILHEMIERRLIPEEQFGFRPKQSTALQLTRLLERVSRNFAEKRLQERFFSMLSRPSTLFWSTASCTSSQSLTLPRT
jgi:hypothetical protein